MKNSHAAKANKRKNTPNTHKSPKQFHICLGLRRSLGEIKTLRHRKPAAQHTSIKVC